MLETLQPCTKNLEPDSQKSTHILEGLCWRLVREGAEEAVSVTGLADVVSLM